MFLVEEKSQRQIARTLGISCNTVAKYCNGNIYSGIRADYYRGASVVTPNVICFIRSACRKMHSNSIRSSTIRPSESTIGWWQKWDSKGPKVTSARRFGHCVDAARNVYVPLSFAVGDVMQIDWGETYAYIDGIRTKLSVCWGRLCYSCALPCVFTNRTPSRS